MHLTPRVIQYWISVHAQNCSTIPSSNVCHKIEPTNGTAATRRPSAACALGLRCVASLVHAAPLAALARYIFPALMRIACIDVFVAATVFQTFAFFVAAFTAPTCRPLLHNAPPRLFGAPLSHGSEARGSYFYCLFVLLLGRRVHQHPSRRSAGGRGAAARHRPKLYQQNVRIRHPAPAAAGCLQFQFQHARPSRSRQR